MLEEQTDSHRGKSVLYISFIKLLWLPLIITPAGPAPGQGESSGLVPENTPFHVTQGLSRGGFLVNFPGSPLFLFDKKILSKKEFPWGLNFRYT
jgi:hypothetical protein